MSKREKQFYCKLGQAVCNVTQMILIAGAFGISIAYMFIR